MQTVAPCARNAAASPGRFSNTMSQVQVPDDDRHNRSLHGLSRTLVSNLVTGVTQGYTIKMEIFGVGYRVQASAATSSSLWATATRC